MRIARNPPQRPEVAAVLCVVDRGGQLLVGRQLVRLVGEAVGVVEAHQFLPQLAQFALLLRGQLAARSVSGQSHRPSPRSGASPLSLRSQSPEPVPVWWTWVGNEGNAAAVGYSPCSIRRVAVR